MASPTPPAFYANEDEEQLLDDDAAMRTIDDGYKTQDTCAHRRKHESAPTPCANLD
jgi:formylmethanofuran:tetrahydromethanopterin formyltransferase